MQCIAASRNSLNSKFFDLFVDQGMVRRYIFWIFFVLFFSCKINMLNPRSWRFGSDDFPDCKWVIFRFHANFQGCGISVYLFIVPWQVVTERYHDFFNTMDIPNLKKKTHLSSRDPFKSLSCHDFIKGYLFLPNRNWFASFRRKEVDPNLSENLCKWIENRLPKSGESVNRFEGENQRPPTKTSTTWNPKQPFFNGCFNWMIPNLYIGNGCFTKHPFINGCLGFQALI